MISSWTEVYSPFHWGDSVASITLVKLEIVLARSWVAAWKDSSTFGLPLRSLDFTTCPLILNFASGDCRKTLAFRDCVLRFLPLWSVNLSNQYLPWGESWPCLSDSPSPFTNHQQCWKAATFVCPNSSFLWDWRYIVSFLFTLRIGKYPLKNHL